MKEAVDTLARESLQWSTKTLDELAKRARNDKPMVSYRSGDSIEFEEFASEEAAIDFAASRSRTEFATFWPPTVGRELAF